LLSGLIHHRVQEVLSLPLLTMAVQVCQHTCKTMIDVNLALNMTNWMLLTIAAGMLLLFVTKEKIQAISIKP